MFFLRVSSNTNKSILWNFSSFYIRILNCNVALKCNVNIQTYDYRADKPYALINGIAINSNKCLLTHFILLKLI